MKTNRPYCLSIAGYDPTAGAGVLADIKTFEMHQTNGMAIISANTLQTDDCFISVNWQELTEMKKHVELLLAHYDIKVLKIGLIQSAKILCQMISHIKDLKPDMPIVWDPILSSSSGFYFDIPQQDDLKYLEAHCTLITPNWTEFQRLWGNDLDVLKQRGINTSILIKGGHREAKVGCDLLFVNGDFVEIEGVSFRGKSKHGTGCVLSAAITACLAKGESLLESCIYAKRYVEKFIVSNDSNLGYHYEKK